LHDILTVVYKIRLHADSAQTRFSYCRIYIFANRLYI